MIVGSRNDEFIDEFLEEFAYETCDLDEEFTESEFKEFKEACKRNGYNITKRDFKIYLDKVKDIRGSDESGFELVTDKDLGVDLPDRIILTDNGAYDLEQQGINGVYTWVGYRHKGSKSESRMVKEVKNVARDIVAPALADYVSLPEKDAHIDDFTDTLDMVRVWIECE